MEIEKMFTGAESDGSSDEQDMDIYAMMEEVAEIDKHSRGT